jgi:stage II sporulation protein R
MDKFIKKNILNKQNSNFEISLIIAMVVAVVLLITLYKLPITNEYPGIMRFHVIANSDSTEDQELKLKVRDYVLPKIEADITNEIVYATNNADNLENIDQVQIMRQYISNNLTKIEGWAMEVLEQEGAQYSTNANIGIRSIPAKNYDDLFFPAGNYEALTITLGSGEGKNWWCVVFPPLCLVDSEDSTYSKEFNIDDNSKIVLKSKILELLKKIM